MHIKNMRTTVIFLLALLLVARTASAQMLSYENEREVMGAAAVSPTSTYRILQLLIAKCGAYSQILNASGNAQLNAWEQRHHAYLEENLLVQTQLEKMYTHPDAKKAYHDMMEKQFPAVVQKQYEAYAATIDAMPNQAGRESMCKSYFGAIKSQKFDLKNNDPVVAEYLNKRIGASAANKLQR